MEGGSARLIELIAVTAALTLLRTLQLDGEVITDCQSIVTTINRTQSVRHQLARPGAALLLMAHRALSSSRTVRWTRSHPEKSHTPPRAWTRDQWGIYLADHIATKGTLPVHTPFSFHDSIITITLDDILAAAVQPTDWHWTLGSQLPLLGGLRATIGALRLHTYTTHRDSSRNRRSAPPIWANSSAAFGTSIWSLSKPGLAKRATACRTLWDLRWHGENQSIAATGHNSDIPLTRCPLCQGYWSQHHVLRSCRSLASTRTATSINLSLATGALPVGPQRDLAKAYIALLLL
jgi:hypothetical protein